MHEPPTREQAVARAWDMLAGGPAVWWADGPPVALPDRVGAVVQTSGSTGGAKRVVLSRDALRHAAESSLERLGRPTHWHLALPPHYVAGLMVLARTHAAGGPPPRLVAPDLHDLAPTGQGDAISLVPTQLHRALRDPATAAKLTSFEAVLIGGAALAPGLRTEAREAGINVVHTYGMSETCGGCVFDGVPLPGVTVDLVPDERARSGGRVALAGPMLFDGYLDRRGVVEPGTVDGRFLTSDRGRWEDARLVIDGRLDDVVITGGVNVDLALVRAAVARHDEAAAVLAVDDEEWGSRIVLFSGIADLERWRELLAHELPREALPRQLVDVAELPRTAGGKPDRAALLRLAAR